MKIWKENIATNPSIIFNDTNPSNYIDITSVTNYMLLGVSYGLTQVQVLQYALAEVLDWTTHAQAEKDLIIAFIEANHFVAVIPTEVRNDVTAPYQGFKIYNSTTGSIEWWQGAAWVDKNSAGLTEVIIPIDFAFDGLYGHSQTSYLSVGKQVIVPDKSLILPNATSIQAKWEIIYFTEGAAAMDVQVYDYTSGLAVAGSEQSLPNTASYVHGIRTDWFNIAENKSFRMQSKRVGGAGNHSVIFEAAQLQVRYKL